MVWPLNVGSHVLVKKNPPLTPFFIYYSKQYYKTTTYPPLNIQSLKNEQFSQFPTPTPPSKRLPQTRSERGEHSQTKKENLGKKEKKSSK